MWFGWFGWFGWFFLVHIWFIYGSYMVHIWFIYCSYMVHIWFIYGSYMVHIWFMDVMVTTDDRWPMRAPMTSLGTTGKHREQPTSCRAMARSKFTVSSAKRPSNGLKSLTAAKKCGNFDQQLTDLTGAKRREWMGMDGLLGEWDDY